MHGKHTRWVKVGFDDEQYSQLLLQAEDECRDKADLLKSLWVKHTRRSIVQELHSRYANRGESSGRASPAGADAGLIGRGFCDTVADHAGEDL